MTKCDFRGTRILMGAFKQGELRFCNAECGAKADLIRVSRTIPDDVVEREVREVHQGSCRKCSGPGPVDVHTSHRVDSALVFTAWSSHPEVCCRACGIKKQIKHGAFSFFLGWWGLPFGLIMTPVQLARNLSGVVGIGEPDPGVPSPALDRAVQLRLAAVGRPR